MYETGRVVVLFFTSKDIRIIQTFWSGGHDPLECGYGIYQNDKLFCSIPISSNGLPRDMIYAKGHVPVGQCEVALPKTGNVTVTITMVLYMRTEVDDLQEILLTQRK